MMIPAGLKKQLPEADREGLVINRGFEKHLVIYSRKEWDKIVEDLSKLNQYEKRPVNSLGISLAVLQNCHLMQLTGCFCQKHCWNTRA